MKIEYKKKKTIGLVLLTVVISITLFTTGCGSSYEEGQAKREEEQKELKRKYEEKEKRIIGQLVNKYNAIYFPPENLGTTVFTYELQEFFITHSQKSFAFKGYLEDIEQTKKGIIIEFLCPLGKDYYIHKKAIKIRLTISEDSVKQFFKGKREDPMWHSIRYILYEADYYVVAKVENIESSRIYSFDGTANGEEVEIDSDISKSFIATGHFIDAVGIPKN